jgi:flagellar biogenesis protein FliO
MSGSYSYHFVKAVITLGFFLGLLLVCAYAIKLYMSRRSLGAGGTGKGVGNASATVRVLHSSALGAKKNLAIVDVAGEVLVLGITPSSINMLTKVTDREAIDLLKKRHSAKRPLFGLLQGGL